MTQEEKELLLKDLCARLHCGVEVYYTETIPISTLKTINSENGTCIVYDHSEWYKHIKLPIEVIKPYLRPMSSMTEEEFKDLKSYSGLIYDQLELQEFFNNSKCLEFYLTEIPSYVVILVFDWLNKRHFDYRGLIGMGLAIETLEDMYNN